MSTLKQRPTDEERERWTVDLLVQSTQITLQGIESERGGEQTTTKHYVGMKYYF